jgi:hypothetical protein
MHRTVAHAGVPIVGRAVFDGATSRLTIGLRESIRTHDTDLMINLLLDVDSRQAAGSATDLPDAGVARTEVIEPERPRTDTPHPLHSNGVEQDLIRSKGYGNDAVRPGLANMGDLAPREAQRVREGCSLHQRAWSRRVFSAIEHERCFGFERAVGRAPISAERIAVVALLAGFDHLVAARSRRGCRVNGSGRGTD